MKQFAAELSAAEMSDGRAHCKYWRRPTFNSPNTSLTRPPRKQSNGICWSDYFQALNGIYLMYSIGLPQIHKLSFEQEEISTLASSNIQ